MSENNNVGVRVQALRPKESWVEELDESGRPTGVVGLVVHADIVGNFFRFKSTDKTVLVYDLKRYREIPRPSR